MGEASRYSSGYVVGIGSNIEPEVNVPRILKALLSRFGSLCMSRVLRTQPVNMASSHDFLNLVVFISARQLPVALKAICNEIEQDLGRDRQDPDRAKKDRVADLDILFPLDPSHPALPLSLAEGTYFQPAVADVYSQLGLSEPVRAARGVRVELDDVSVGEMPASIHLDRGTGQIMVFEDGS